MLVQPVPAMRNALPACVNLCDVYMGVGLRFEGVKRLCSRLTRLPPSYA